MLNRIAQNWFRLSVLLVLSLFAIAVFLPAVPSCVLTKNLSDLSNYGQWFGAVGSLFAGISLIAAFHVIDLQRQQIRDSKQTTDLQIQALLKVAETINAQVMLLAKTADINGLAAIVSNSESIFRMSSSDKDLNIRRAKNALELLLERIGFTLDDDNKKQ